jgi:16S rRNA (uracil1498-N3)-methyltransferase
MIQFFAPDIESTGLLPEQESVHCCRVLRMKAGDCLTVVDGAGHIFECMLTDANPRSASVEIISKSDEIKAWRPRITLAVAPTKNGDRMEWLVEKAVEMGIDEIILLNCQHSERRKFNIDRLRKIAISAMKQSLKATLPNIPDMIDFKLFISSVKECDRYMGYCDKDYPRREFVKEYDGRKDVTILVGPEGDFSPEEVQIAVEAGFIPVTFGNTRLRTETAALYAVAAVHTLDNMNI